MCVCAYVQRSISEISKVAGETQWCGSIKIKPTTCPNHHRSSVCKIHYSFVRNVHTCTHSGHEEQQANKTLTYLVYQKQAQWNLGCEKSQIFSPLRSHFLQTFPILLPSAGVHAASEQRIIIGLHNHHAVQYECRPSSLPPSLSVLSWPTNQALLCSWVIYAKCNSPETEVNLPVLLALLLQLLHVEKLPLQNAPGFSASNSNPENFITGKGLPPRFAGASWSQEQSGRAGPRTLGEGKGWCVYVKGVGDWQSIFSWNWKVIFGRRIDKHVGSPTSRWGWSSPKMTTDLQPAEISSHGGDIIYLFTYLKQRLQVDCRVSNSTVPLQETSNRQRNRTGIPKSERMLKKEEETLDLVCQGTQ